MFVFLSRHSRPDRESDVVKVLTPFQCIVSKKSEINHTFSEMRIRSPRRIVRIAEACIMPRNWNLSASSLGKQFGIFLFIEANLCYFYNIPTRPPWRKPSMLLDEISYLGHRRSDARLLLLTPGALLLQSGDAPLKFCPRGKNRLENTWSLK